MANLVWFRNDLRTFDNSSLAKACAGGKTLAVYCFDPRQFAHGPFGFKKTAKYRARFLIETVTELRTALQKLNISLFVFQKKPEEIIPKLAKDENITNIYLQREWTSEERKVFTEVKSKTSPNVNFVQAYDQFLFHPEDIPYENFDSIPQVFTNFRKTCEKNTRIRHKLQVPLPRPITNLLANETKIPTLNDLGFQDFEMDSRTAFPFKGGEQEGLKRITNYFWETNKLVYYKKTRNGLIGKNYSSKLSAWLANGSVSARFVYWEVKRFEKEVKKNEDTYWLIFELIWRDYFKYISLKHGNRIFQLPGILNKDYKWKSSKDATKSWIEGATKEPFINANMIEIAKTGWMSNRGRQNVASFWAKELGQDWRIGASYFESLLIDYDVHSNWGNWMYNSGVGNDPRDRKFNIKRQAEHYDKNGSFQNLWLQPSLF